MARREIHLSFFIFECEILISSEMNKSGEIAVAVRDTGMGTDAQT